MSRTVDLPVGDRPGWELHDKLLKGEGSEFLSVAESLVLLQSLKQSRERWLTSAFPRLPKGRGSKQVAQSVPLHEYKAHDKFELSVGPSIFPETALFEVVYTTDAHTPSTRPAGFASPELINMIRTKPAYDADYKRLGELLQSMFPEHLGPNATSQPSATRQQKWDLVIEFREKPADRWIFPRGLVQLGRAYDTTKGKRFDVMISTMLPYTQDQIGLDLQSLDQQKPPTGLADADAKPSPVTFHWKGLTPQIYELLTQWSLQPENWEQFKSSSRMYLPHRLPEGDLLEIIRVALAPTWTLKSIKPANADSGRSKRRNYRRKPAPEKASAPTTLDPAPFTWPTVPPPLNIVQVQPGPSPSALVETGPPPSASLKESSPTTVALLQQHESSGRTRSPSSHKHPPTEEVGLSPRPGADSLQTVESSTLSGESDTVVAERRLRPRTPPTSTSPSIRILDVNETSGSTSNLSNASSPTGSPSPSLDGSEPPHKRQRIQPKTRFSHPLPACKTCKRTNVQLLQGGQFCRMCIDIHRPQPPPPPPPPSRPQYHHTSSYSSSYSPPPASSYPTSYSPPHASSYSTTYSPSYPPSYYQQPQYPVASGYPITFNVWAPPPPPPS